MPSVRPAPPDQQQRDLALDPRHSILVQAPAGSGKTTLLAERFLSLLAAGQQSSVTAISGQRSNAIHLIFGGRERGYQVLNLYPALVGQFICGF